MKGNHNMNSRTSLFRHCTSVLSVLFVLILATTQSFATFHQAAINAEAGLAEALHTTIPVGRHFVRIEKRDDVILVYKVSMHKLDDRTVKIRVTGFDGQDEVQFTTFRLLDDGKYKN